MVDSAGNPVRLDPWQNIVGVSWGAPAPDPGDPKKPGYRGGACAAVADASSVDVEWKWSVFLGGGSEPFDGELLIAHVAAGGASAVLPPGGAGEWSELYQETAFIDGVAAYTAGVWFRTKEPGDPDVFTFTTAGNDGMSGVAGVIGRADQRLGAVPNAISLNTTPVGEIPISSPLFIEAVNPLIICFLDTNSASFLQQNYPEPPNPPWFKRYRCRPPDGSHSHGMIGMQAFASVFGPGPGTLQATAFSPFNGFSEIFAVVAFEGEPV